MPVVGSNSRSHSEVRRALAAPRQRRIVEHARGARERRDHEAVPGGDAPCRRDAAARARARGVEQLPPRARDRRLGLRDVATEVRGGLLERVGLVKDARAVLEVAFLGHAVADGRSAAASSPAIASTSAGVQT